MPLCAALALAACRMSPVPARTAEAEAPAKGKGAEKGSAIATPTPVPTLTIAPPGNGVPAPPDFMRITRVAASDLATPVNAWPAALARTFTGQSAAALPRLEPTTGTLGTTETRQTAGLAELAARATARRAALRVLAAAILATTGTANQTLRAQLALQPTNFGTLANLLETQTQVHYAPAPGGVAATAQLAGSAVVAAFKLDQTNAQPSADELNAARQRARDSALEQAKAALREQLLATPLAGGETFGQRFAQDQPVLNEVDALVFLLQPDEIHYMPDGSARVTLFFDRNQVRNIAASHARRGFWARIFRRGD